MGAWDRGSDTRWRRVRAGVLRSNRAENQGRCVLAIPGVCTGVATQVHHTKGREVTGDDPKFLVASCRECNLKVGKPGKTSPEPKKISNW